MQGIRSIIARGALCAVLLTVSAPSALACGNMYLYPMLFLAYSEAGRAFDAERLARRSGEVSAAVWSSELGLTYHQLRGYLKKYALVGSGPEEEDNTLE